uniref:Uncharacterized protein n=1 Tax=Kalanchoe fedtschenkoi TaxID=63787 RepID=A0A7N0VH71_KALFE
MSDPLATRSYLEVPALYHQQPLFVFPLKSSDLNPTHFPNLRPCPHLPRPLHVCQRCPAPAAAFWRRSCPISNPPQ